MTSVPYAEVIGDPVAHSKSPLIHGFWLEKLGLEGAYHATPVRTDELGDFLAARRQDPLWRGCNVTMPLKAVVPAFLDAHRDPSMRDEPVNLVISSEGRLTGTNTDIVGLLQPLRALDAMRLAIIGEERASEPRAAVILGSGGVLQSVVRALRGLGYHPITIIARDEQKVRASVGPSSGQVQYLPWGARIAPCDLLVNVTPLGMAGQPPLPYGADGLRPGGILFEMIYHPLVTPLVADAQARGLRVVDGLQMLVAQAAPSFERLFGTAPPREHDDELRKLLTA